MDGVWTREEAEVTDGRLSSVAESAASRLAVVPAMPALRIRCSKVADGRLASSAKSTCAHVGRFFGEQGRKGAKRCTSAWRFQSSGVVFVGE